MVAVGGAGGKEEKCCHDDTRMQRPSDQQFPPPISSSSWRNGEEPVGPEDGDPSGIIHTHTTGCFQQGNKEKGR